jgi:hypothetical protein
MLLNASIMIRSPGMGIYLTKTRQLTSPGVHVVSSRFPKVVSINSKAHLPWELAKMVYPDDPVSYAYVTNRPSTTLTYTTKAISLNIDLHLWNPKYVA